MRLAWLSPLPPLQSGIAAYSAEILPLLAESHEIDVFVDVGVPDRSGQLAWAAAQGWTLPPRLGSSREETLASGRSATPADARLPPRLAARSAHELLPLHDRQPYDLIVYQVGNAACHDYVWPYALRFPGLLVLHDGTVHHARARALLSRQRVADYRAEFRANHPEADPWLAEHAIVGAPGHHYYRWPMRRLLVEGARAVAVHGAWLAEDLRREHPEAEVMRLRMGVGQLGAVAPAEFAPGALVVAAFGLATSEKRLPVALEAFAATFAGSPDTRFVIVGAAPPHFDPEAEARRLGIAAQVTLTGYVSEADLGGWMLRADICLCLRWPTSGETSASWLRCLAAGRATVVSGLRHHLDVPSLDARTGAVMGEAPDRRPAHEPEEAVCVSIDLVDEREALCQAYRRLASDRPFRERLGRNAARHWQAAHTLAHMARDYEQAFARAGARPARRREDLPAHLTDEAAGLARAIVGHVGVEADVLATRQPPPRPVS